MNTKSILCFLVGISFIIAGIIGKNLPLIAIGCCMIVLGFVHRYKNTKK